MKSAAAIVAAAAAVAAPTIVAAAAEENDDQDDDPQAVAAAETVIKAPHNEYLLDIIEMFEIRQGRFSLYLMPGEKIRAWLTDNNPQSWP